MQVPASSPVQADPPNYRLPGGKLPLLISLVSLGGVVGYAATQQPGEGGPIVVLGFLLLCFVALVSSLVSLLQALLKLTRWRFSAARLFYTALVWGLGGIFLLGLQTLRQLQLIDIFLVVVFEILINFYLIRRF